MSVKTADSRTNVTLPRIHGQRRRRCTGPRRTASETPPLVSPLGGSALTAKRLFQNPARRTEAYSAMKQDAYPAHRSCLIAHKSGNSGLNSDCFKNSTPNEPPV